MKATVIGPGCNSLLSKLLVVQYWPVVLREVDALNVFDRVTYLSSLIEQSLTSNQHKELKRLKKTRSRRIRNFILLAILIIFLTLYYNNNSSQRNEGSINLESARKALTLENSDWARNLSAEQLALQEWLAKRGTSIEQYLFNSFSSYIFVSASKSLPINLNAENLGAFEGFYLSLHSGILRVSFILIACFRIWLLVLGYAIYTGTRGKKVYEGPDLLGQTGNSRAFYSGIRAGLENLNEDGAPNKQVRGLACPKKVSDSVLKSSKLYGILERYEVVNGTNSGLASVILEYDKLPAYLAPHEEAALLSGFTKRTSLSENCTVILERILDLHAYYQHRSRDKEFEAYLEDFSAYNNNKTLSPEEFAKFLQKSLHRTLTQEMREVLAEIPQIFIATTVLALEAGKILVFKYEGERWLRNSNYPQLCARSILHSIEQFAEEYNFNQRTIIRQALIYSSRSGDFGPVKLPVDMSDQTRALRQWTEVLISNPHDMSVVADEVEMYGLVFEAHKKFKSALLDKIMIGDKEALENTYAPVGNLFLVPFTTIYKLTRYAVSSKGLRRLDELARLESQRQKLKVVQNDGLIDATDKNLIPANSKVFAPLSEAELKSLSETHKLPLQALREWSSLRMILNNFGWLARRVGDYSVPESSIIFAVMKADPAISGVNEYGLLGKAGMVPLRATQLEERWGKTWQSRTTQVFTATMAETQEDYEKLLRGEAHHELDNNSIVNI